MATKYTVQGSHRYWGHEPGSTFEGDPTDPRIARGVERGSLKLASGEDAPEERLEDKTRDELNAIAESLGVNEPETLDNKAAVIEAIRSYDKE